MEIGQVFQLVSLIVVLVLAYVNIQNARSNKTEDQKETASTQLILSKIELSETRMMGKLDGLTKGQSTMEKKIEEMEKDLKEKSEDSHEKDQIIKDLIRQVSENKDWIEELKGRYKNLEQHQGLKNVSDLVIPKK
jgi:predicted RNase H-like nuclease (RuvC/YqgF family)